MRIFLYLLVTVLLSACGFAQNPDPPKFSMKLDSKAFSPGATVKGSFFVEFAPGLHGYQNPPNKDFLNPISVMAKSKGIKLTPKYPKGELITMANEETPTAVYKGKVEIPFTLVLPKKAGKHKLEFELQYQQCDDHNCWPPATSKLTFDVVVKKTR